MQNYRSAPESLQLRARIQENLARARDARLAARAGDRDALEEARYYDEQVEMLRGRLRSMGHRPNPTRDSADELLEYLNTPYLVYDERFIRAFIEDEDLEFPTDADGEPLSDYDLEAWAEETQAKAYEEWFRFADILGMADSEGIEIDFPTPYRDGNTATGWFIHFTPSVFTHFEDGVPREYLGESRATAREVNRTVRCPANLEAPADKQLWIHAWEVFAGGEYLNDQMLYKGSQYGNNALLFQSDQAVVAQNLQHDGDEHALILGCSEYNAVQLLDVSREWLEDEDKYTLQGTAVLENTPAIRKALEDYEYLSQSEDDPNEVLFEDIEQLIDFLDSVSTRRNPPSFWHPLALEA